jgi:hypothetical protein
MGHLVKRDTCLSRPQAKRVGGAPAINRHWIWCDTSGGMAVEGGNFGYEEALGGGDESRVGGVNIWSLHLDFILPFLSILSIC